MLCEIKHNHDLDDPESGYLCTFVFPARACRLSKLNVHFIVRELSNGLMRL